MGGGVKAASETADRNSLPVDQITQVGGLSSSDRPDGDVRGGERAYSWAITDMVSR